MVLDSNINNLEKGKFVDTVDGPAVRTTIDGGSFEGTFTPTGLSTGLRQRVVTVTDVVTAIPLTPFANRNGLTLRVWGISTIFIGDENVTASTGYPRQSKEEMNFDVRDTVIVYAVCSLGESSEVRVMEVA